MGGRVCFHGYQSFKADEVTAEVAHEIGVKLAQELWGDRFEVVVATHCNTGHYHNHFVLNSVSFADGLKFDNTPADYARMREVSDRLCREYAISVIENPGGRAKNYAEWQAERSGKPTHRGTIRADIDRAILASTTERDFIQVMTEMGYQLKTRGKGGKPLKYPALKPPDAKGYFRFHKLGEGYSLEQIKERILHNLQKQVPFPEAVHRPPRHYRVRGKPRKKVTGLRALYFRYCYAAVCLEGAVIVLACIIFSVFASAPPTVDPDAAAASMVWSYIGELVFNMLILVGSVKMSDHVVREMMGL